MGHIEGLFEFGQLQCDASDVSSRQILPSEDVAPEIGTALVKTANPLYFKVLILVIETGSCTQFQVNKICLLVHNNFDLSHSVSNCT